LNFTWKQGRERAALPLALAPGNGHGNGGGNGELAQRDSQSPEPLTHERAHLGAAAADIRPTEHAVSPILDGPSAIHIDSLTASISAANVAAISDTALMLRIRGPSAVTRPHVSLFDRSLTKLGDCLCDTGASSAMLISDTALQYLRSLNLVDYVYDLSQEEIGTRQLSTFSDAKDQPYIASIAGIILCVVMEDQRNEAPQRTVTATVNCSVVRRASKFDYLVGTQFLAAKGWIPLVSDHEGRVHCETLSRTGIFLSDPPHPSVLRYLLSHERQARLWTHPEISQRQAQRVRLQPQVATLGAPPPAGPERQPNPRKRYRDEPEDTTEEDSCCSSSSSDASLSQSDLEAVCDDSDNEVVRRPCNGQALPAAETSDTELSDTPSQTYLSNDESSQSDLDEDSNASLPSLGLASSNDSDDEDEDTLSLRSDLWDTSSEEELRSDSDDDDDLDAPAGASGAFPTQANAAAGTSATAHAPPEQQSHGQPTSREGTASDHAESAIHALLEELADERPCRDLPPIAQLHLCTNLLLEDGRAKQAVFVVADDTSSLTPESYYYVENIESTELDFIINAGVVDGLSLIDGSIRIEAVNLKGEDLTLRQGTHVANVYAYTDPFFLSEKDPAREEKMRLYSEYNALSERLMNVIESQPHATKPTLSEICALLDIERDSTAFEEQRKAIHALSPSQITQQLRAGTLHTHQITAHVVPMIDLFAGIGGFAKGAHAALLPDGRMAKVFLAVDNDLEKGRVFQRNNPDVPFLKYSLGNDFSQAKEMIKDFIPSDLLPFAFAYANPPA
jgi:hypothetical protein